MTHHPAGQRRLIVMRHAKSSHDSGAATDHERPLNKRGRRDAPRVAHHLAEIGWQPDFILSSDSTRTRQTLDIMQTAWEREVRFELCEELYHGGYRDLCHVADLIPEQAITVLALGHNPGWENLVSHLCGQYVSLKTASNALLTCDHGTCWHDALVSQDLWQLCQLLHPREI